MIPDAEACVVSSDGDVVEHAAACGAIARGHGTGHACATVKIPRSILFDQHAKSARRLQYETATEAFAFLSSVTPDIAEVVSVEGYLALVVLRVVEIETSFGSAASLIFCPGSTEVDRGSISIRIYCVQTVDGIRF